MMIKSVMTENFHPIPIRLLQDGLIPPIDLFIQRDEEDFPILFLSQSLSCDKKMVHGLTERKIHQLWVRDRDYQTVTQHLNQNLPAIIRNTSIPLPSRCSITYDLSLVVMQQVFEAADPIQVVKASQEILQNIIELIFSDEHAAYQFLTIASKDYALYSHSINVCLYGMALALRALHISKEEALTRFGPGFLLHDIGKLAVPQEILQKVEPLTVEEMELIMQHPQKALEMVERTMQISEEMGSMILYHHERLDGSGYLSGLRQDEISIPARICAVVDTFDAINTNRPYQARRPTFEAFRIMKEQEIPHRLDEAIFREFVLIFKQNGM